MAIELSQLFEGLSPETITSVTEAIKANSEKLSAKVFIDGDDRHYVPAVRLSEVVAERDSLNETLTAQKAQLDSLTNLTKDNEAAQATIQNLQTQLSAANTVSKQAAIKAAIAEKQAELNPVAPIADLLDFLDMNAIEVDGATIKNLDSQLETLKANKPYLFKAAESGQGTPPPAGTGKLGSVLGALGGSGSGGLEVGTFGKLLASNASPKSVENPYFK